jgi:uncharacterized membrane protein YhaH (DUF805 family)
MCMHELEPTRWDDVALAVLLLLIGVPEAVFAAVYQRPIDAQGALSMICVMVGLVILMWRNGRLHAKRGHDQER